MMRAEKLGRLFDQVLIVVPDLLRRGQRGGTVGSNVHFSQRIVGEFYHLEKLASDHGRIDKCGQGNRGKMDIIAALIGYGQWRSKLPALRKFQAGCVIDVV